MVAIYVTHRRVANKEVNDRVSSKYCLFSHKRLWTFCQMLCGVSKHRALPASSRVILSYNSLQMICLCWTTHKTWFHAATIAGFYTVCRKTNRECTARYDNRQNGAKVACHSIFNVLPPTSSDFILYIIFTLAISVPVTLTGVPRTSTRWEKSTLHRSQSHGSAVDN